MERRERSEKAKKELEKNPEEIAENLKGVGFDGSNELGSAVEEISTPGKGVSGKVKKIFGKLFNSSSEETQDKEND